MMDMREKRLNEVKERLTELGHDETTIHCAEMAYQIGYLTGESEEKGKWLMEQWGLKGESE